MAHAPVLVVEDDQDIRESLQAVLEDAGYATEAAANGRDALERIAEHRPSVIILDLMMPVMNGYEFLARATTDPTLAGIPIIIATAVPELPPLTSPVVARLKKPLDLGLLLGTVDRYYHAT